MNYQIIVIVGHVIIANKREIHYKGKEGLMVSNVVFTISLNILSNLMYETGGSLFQRICLRLRLRKIKKWSKTYIINHDGSILTTGDFESFILNYHPLERIVSSVSEGNDEKTKERLIKDIIQQFDESYDGKCTAIDRSEIKDFFSVYYDKIDSLYTGLLSPAEKYSNAKTERATIRATDTLIESGIKNTEQILSEVDDIKSMLNGESVIDNPSSIFMTLVAVALGGDIATVNSLLPLIEGKSKDLEIAVPLLVSIIRGSDSWISEFKDAELSIVDDQIYTSLTYIAVYMACYNNNEDGLNSIGDRCKNAQKIAYCITAEEYDDLFTLEKRDDEGLPVLSVKLKDTFQKELWLTSRVCMNYLLGEKFFIDEENLKTILVEPYSIIDDIVLAERMSTQTFAKYNTTSADLEILYNKYEKLRQQANEIDKKYKARLYALLLRLLITLSTEKAREFFSTIPMDVREYDDIQMLAELINVKEGNVDFDKIMGLCMRQGEYWLFADSILQIIEKSPEKARGAIEKYIFVIEIDTYCFLAYLWSLSACGDIDALGDVINKYENKYNYLYEFWIEKIKFTKSEKDLETAVKKSMERELEFSTKTGINDWISLLYDYNKYEELSREIEAVERTDQITNNLLYYKGIALSCTNKEIEALTIFEELFKHGNHSNAVVYNLLALAIKNSRDVEDEILLCAEKSGHSELLMAAAEYRKRSGERELAVRDAKKALLRAENNSRAYGFYIGIAIDSENDEEKEAVRCDVNTIITLKAQNQKETVIAIHEDEMLPEDNYSWHDVKHIYIGTAIEYDLLRKTVGEDVDILGDKYRIEKIEWLDTFLERLCFEVMVESGTAKAITLQTDNSGKLDVQSLAESIKDIMGDNSIINDWINQYKDPAQVPIPFAVWPKACRAQTFQVIDAIYDDKFIYREINSNNKIDDVDYILSYSALCILHKLGWKNEADMKNKVVIPEVLKSVISIETDKVKQEYNKEHVATLGVNDGKVFFVEEDEASKRRTISEANRLKLYCDGFESVGNVSDIRFTNHEKFDLREILGLVDYEALVIAENKNLILVSAEIPLTAISTVEEISVNVLCIADFLAVSTKNEGTLLEYIYKLVEHRFVLAITDCVVDKIMSAYIQADEETRKQILNKWEDILKQPISDDEYKLALATVISENILQNDKHRKDFLNPVIQMLIQYVYKYLGLAFTIGVRENGELYVQTFRIEDSDQT